MHFLVSCLVGFASRLLSTFAFVAAAAKEILMSNGVCQTITAPKEILKVQSVTDILSIINHKMPREGEAERRVSPMGVLRLIFEGLLEERASVM